MKPHLLFALCITFFAAQLEANHAALRIPKAQQKILIPKPGGRVVTARPTFCGILYNPKTKKPLRGKNILLRVNDQYLGIVPTDNLGVWSFRLKPNQALTDGCHLLQSRTTSCPNLQAAAFVVQAARGGENCTEAMRSGNVSAQNSAVTNPAHNDYSNTSRPTIVVFLGDSTSAPVSGESVDIFVDSVKVTATPVVSNSNGVASYQLSVEQALSEGSHAVYAHAIESNVTLSTNTFTVDTVAPAAPVITTPADQSTVTDSPFDVVGTSEANSVITLFVDGDTADVISANGSGNWTSNINLSNAEYILTAIAEDAAFNVSPLSEAVSITVNV